MVLMGKMVLVGRENFAAKPQMATGQNWKQGLIIYLWHIVINVHKSVSLVGPVVCKISCGTLHTYTHMTNIHFSNVQPLKDLIPYEPTGAENKYCV